MPVMDSVYYLPSEVLNSTNYPEVALRGADIKSIVDYAMTVNNALTYYNQGVFDHIDLQASDLQKYITLARSVCSTLGNASNVCYDVLLEIRNFQSLFQQALYMAKQYGSTYIGTPTATAGSDS